VAALTRELPFSGDFSPGIISDLGKLLRMVSKHHGDRASMTEAIRREYFSGSAAKRADPAERREQQEKRANNVILALAAYGLLDLKTQSLTPVGSELLAATSFERRAELFAKHILLKCGGITVLDAVRHLQRQGTRPTKLELAKTLRDVFRIKLARAQTKHTAILNWLALARVCGKAESRHIDEKRVAKLTGIDPSRREGWHALSADQQHVARALRELCRTHGEDSLPARDVYEYAMNKYGLAAPEDQLANQIFRPLEEAGWLTRTVRGGGRGGKSGSLQATKQLLSPSIEKLLDEPSPHIPPDLTKRLQEPLAKIRQHLRASKKSVKGIALELLALRMVMDLGLVPTGFRVRSSDTGGAEVDLTAEGAHLLFSRWTFQCKNIKKVNLSDLAKEIGMATLLKAHVVVLVAMGTFASTVEHFARQVAQTTPLQVVLVPGTVVARYLESGERSIGVLMAYFRRTAGETMRLKGPQRDEVEAGASLMTAGVSSEASAG
jgi:hypothetical protein